MKRYIAIYQGPTVGIGAVEALGTFESFAKAEEALRGFFDDWHSNWEPEPDDFDDEQDYHDAVADFWSDIDCYVEEYDPEKHDMLRAGGGSFEEDFED